MVDQGVTKLGWLPDGAFIDWKNPKASELNAAVDLTCAMVSDYTVGPSGSDTVNEKSVCEVANTTTFTSSNYAGGFNLFRYTDAADDIALSTFTSKGLFGWFVRRIGKAWDTPYAAADIVELYYFTTDDPQPMGGAGSGFVKVMVPLGQQGRFDTSVTVSAAV